MFESLIGYIVFIILGPGLLVVAIYLQLRRRQQQRAELESRVKELERRAELESQVKKLELRVSKFEESLKKQ